jgi:hypothetical protein
VQTQAPATSSGAAEEEAAPETSEEAPAEPAEEEAASEDGAEPAGEPVTLQFISVSVPDDAHTQGMEGVKLRMPNTPTWLFMGEALGANPTPLAFTEVYLGLQTGTIDGQDNPLPTDKNA